MVHQFLSQLLILPLLLGISVPMQANIFLDAAQVHVNKITDKKPIHKSPVEFKQAVARYIKHTDRHYFCDNQRNSDENVSYKKELRYLFKNYEKLSVNVLLSRLRSAHQAMVKHDTDSNAEGYKKYEQICSALLLACAQVFVNDARNQILQALDEIDNLIAYWRYQQHHQISYFFGKSPLKWIIGKNQEKEIIHNIIKLEHVQSKLYTLLGTLTGHIHTFTEIGTTYDDCYAWIEKLVSCVGNEIKYKSDGTRFDAIAAQLELKMKQVSKLKHNCMASLKMAKKPGHFVRHWIAYTTAVAALSYVIYYNSKNPEIVRSAINAVHDEAEKFLVLLLHPLKKVYERGKLIFSEENKIDDSKNNNAQENSTELGKLVGEIVHAAKSLELNVAEELAKSNTSVCEDGLTFNSKNNNAQENSIDREAELDTLVDKIVYAAEGLESRIAEELAKSNTSVREDGLNFLRDAIEKLENPNDGYLWNSQYTFDKEAIINNIKKIEKVVEPIKQDGKVINKKEVDDYKQAVREVYNFINIIGTNTHWKNREGLTLWWYLTFSDILLRLDDDYLTPLQRYTDIIDENIVPLFQIAPKIVENLVSQAKGLIKGAENLIKGTENLIKKAEDLEIKADQQLRDHELTLMFTSLIPLGITCFGASKGYQWITERDYSPIRIALADVNSLLIESSGHLDDHDYGKLVYLICKLRHKSTSLKDPLSNEFLADVAKLESKQYAAQTKRGIVENMFNKYAFLGRIAV